MRIQNSELRIGNSRIVQHSGGFTLIEVLVSSTILAFAAAAVMSISRFSVQAYSSTFERTQAYFLVQEGLEIVRSIRDNQSLDHRSNNWAILLPNPSASSEVWRAVWDAQAGRWQLATGSEDIQLDPAVDLHFIRIIRFESVPNLPGLVGSDGTILPTGIAENIRRVTVEVEWAQAGTPASVRGSTLLSNWQPED